MWARIGKLISPFFVCPIAMCRHPERYGFDLQILVVEVKYKRKVKVSENESFISLGIHADPSHFFSLFPLFDGYSLSLLFFSLCPLVNNSSSPLIIFFTILFHFFTIVEWFELGKKRRKSETIPYFTIADLGIREERW